MSNTRLFRCIVALALPLAVACGDDGGTTDGGGDTTVTVDSGGDTGAADTGAGDTGTGGSPCPATEPSGACTDEGLECEYGDDPRLDCRDLFTCTGGAWVGQTSSSCPPIVPATCPDSREEAQGTACDPDGAVCEFDGLACYCTNCPRGSPVCMDGPTLWSCDAPNADPECPPAPPNRGTVCTPEGKVCNYGCEEDTQRTCTGGIWIAGTPPGGCPMSSRRVKRDIRYLDAAEVQSLAEAVESTRLATYEYTDPALAGRTRLGFIIEDQPASFAVDPERSQVDLYGYTSMLVAAVQAQERRIAELEQQIARVEQCR